MKTVETPGVRGTVWLLAGAIVVLGVLVLGGLRFFAIGAPTRAREAASSRSARAETGRRVPRPAPGPARRIVPRSLPRHPGPDRPPAAVGAAPPADSPPNGAEEAAPAEDQPSGIALFPPPGTEPPKSGIIVPEDFDLPEGYVRHHQVTDDGHPLPPILMFHPDYEFFDENGAPIEIPADRVVPPELAPPGLNVEMLEVPDTTVPMIEPEAEPRE